MTTSKERIRELRAELRKLEDEDDAPPITRADVKSMSAAEINRAFDDGRLSDILRAADKPPVPESGPVA